MKYFIKIITFFVFIIFYFNKQTFSKTDTLNFSDRLKYHIIPHLDLGLASGVSIPKQHTWDPIGIFEPKFKESFSYKVQLCMRFKLLEGLNALITPNFSKLGYKYNDFELAFPAGMIFQGYNHEYYYYGNGVGVELYILESFSITAAYGRNYLIKKISTSDSNFKSLNNFGNVTQNKTEGLTLSCRYKVNRFGLGLIYDIPLSESSIEKDQIGGIRDYTKITGIYLLVEYTIL